MYVGRIAAVAWTRSGRNAALYRVSSRSFPNRAAVERGGRLAIVPRPGHEGDARENPYVAYTCLRTARGWAVAGNGSHTDPVAEKIEAGLPPRDALANCLLAMDYEKDAWKTPRIAGCAPLTGDAAWLAVVRADALVVKQVPLRAGRAWYVATYEHDDVRDAQCVEFDAGGADEAARRVIDGPGFAALEKPVAAAAALADGERFQLGACTI